MAKKQKVFTVHHYITYEDKDAETENTPAEPSDAHALHSLLKRALQENEAKTFESLLKGDFIYPGNGLIENHKSLNTHYCFDPYTSTYQGNHHTRFMRHKYYLVRPIIETLFFEYNTLFRDLVASIAESENPAIHDAFVESFHGTDIPSEILLPWNEDMQQNIKAGIKAISEYGSKLFSQEIPRAGHAISLCSALGEHLKTLPLIENTNTSKAKWLDMKFKFIRSLHSHDMYFAGHRNEWTPLISNVASLVFSIGILNLINLCVTGNFFFFNQTRTQGLVSSLDYSVEPERLAFN